MAVERLKEFEDNEKEADWYKGLVDDWDRKGSKEDWNREASKDDRKKDHKDDRNRKGSKDDWNRKASKDDWKKGLESTSEDHWPNEGKIEFVEYSMRYR